MAFHSANRDSIPCYCRCWLVDFKMG